jgi:hypothetical protein
MGEKIRYIINNNEVFHCDFSFVAFFFVFLVVFKRKNIILTYLQ